MLEMKVKGLALDSSTNMPIVILKDMEEERALPIWIGIFEANAIAIKMKDVPVPRPMTHDLIKNILEEIKITVSRIVINDMEDNTFFAVILLSIDGNEVSIDSRPSDAIALALRVDAPIFVAKKVLDEARSIDLTDPRLEDDKEKWKEWLEDLRPEDFGKHEM
ncbi:MAG: bifunctional nuclease family protein [Nitrospinae bacterium]|nr:bifunctional nuclease family protein [Nitrospinota bacterium]